MRYRFAWAVMAALAGCSGDSNDPETSVLQPGTQAVAVLDKDRPKFDGAGSDKVAFWENKDKNEGMFAGYVGLAPGVRVTIGEDPGYSEVTQKEIDESVKRAEEWEKGALSDAEIKVREAEVITARRQKPQKYYPPDKSSGSRSVMVVVESGEHRGVAGRMTRRHLRPIKP